MEQFDYENIAKQNVQNNEVNQSDPKTTESDNTFYIQGDNTNNINNVEHTSVKKYIHNLFNCKRNKVIAICVSCAVILSVYAITQQKQQGVMQSSSNTKINNKTYSSKSSQQTIKNIAKNRLAKKAAKKAEYEDIMNRKYADMTLDQLYDKNWLPIADSSTKEARQKLISQYGSSESDITYDGAKNWRLYYKKVPDYQVIKEKGRIFKSKLGKLNIADQFYKYFMYHSVNHDVSYYNGTAEKAFKNATGSKLTPAQKEYADRAEKVIGPGKSVLYAEYADRIGYYTTNYFQHNQYHPRIEKELEKDGVTYTLDMVKNPFEKSISSVAEWMRYDAGFYDVLVSNSGVIGTCRLGKHGAEVQEIVLPSLTNSKKFDVFIDDLSDLSRYAETFSTFDYMTDLVSYADMLRQNSKTLPFKVVLHNIDRPLRATDNEVGKVASKFGLTEDYLESTVPERYQRYVQYKREGGPGLGNWDLWLAKTCRYSAHTTTCEDKVNPTTLDQWIYIYKINNAIENVPSRDRIVGKNTPITYEWGIKNYHDFLALDRAQFGN